MRNHVYYYNKLLATQKLYSLALEGDVQDKTVAIKELSVNFVPKSMPILRQRKNIPTIRCSHNIYYDVHNHAYVTRESGYVYYYENGIQLYPFLHFNEHKTHVQAIIPNQAYLARGIDVGLLRQEIAAKGLVIDEFEEVFNKLLAIYSSNGGVVTLARGADPQAAICGVIELRADKTAGFDLSYRLANNFLSYERIKFTAPAYKDEIIGAYIAPIKKKIGRDVCGNNINIDIPLSRTEWRGHGKGIYVNEEEGVAYASVSGTIKFSFDNIPIVAPTQLITHDVNEYFSTNNDLIIEGSVLARAYIISAGDITIRGNLTGGHVIAGGSVIIEGSINNKAFIKADAHVEFQFASNVEIIARGSVKVRKYVINSTIHALGYLKVYDREKGSIAGGNIYVGEHVEAAIGGSPSEPSTHVEILQSSERHQLKIELDYLARQEAMLENQIEKLKMIYGARYMEEASLVTQDAKRRQKIKLGRAQYESLKQQLKITSALRKRFEEVLRKPLKELKAFMRTPVALLLPEKQAVEKANFIRFTKRSFPNLRITIQRRGIIIRYHNNQDIQFLCDAKGHIVQKRVHALH